MKKNIGPFLAFTREWFSDHQRALLWLLNTPVIGRWFRWCLCIRSCDVGYRRAILEIRPNCYTVAGDEPGTFVTDFRTHPKYAKRLYFAFRPLWWGLHWWDTLADVWAPEWSFGFETLTVYPDVLTGATTVDGFINRTGVNETFATIRAGAGNDVDPTANILTTGLTASTTANQYATMRRSILTFDTGSIPTAAEISSAVFSLFGNSKEAALGETPMHVAGASPATNNNLVTGDYANIDRVTFGNVTYSAFSTSAYNDIILNAAGIGDIVKAGISQFSLQLEWDINNSFTGTWVSAVATGITPYAADDAGSTRDPKLTVIYVIGSAILPSNALRPSHFSPGIAR